MGGILDFHRWKSGFPYLLFNHEIDRVKVRLPLSSSRDLDERTTLKFLYEPVDARNAHGNILGETFLAGETKIVVPGIAEEKRVDRLRADRNVRVAQNEIRNLREAMKRHRVDGVELHVAFDTLDLIAYMFHLAIISLFAKVRSRLSPSLSPDGFPNR
jgi:hypothetical protein